METYFYLCYMVEDFFFGDFFVKLHRHQIDLFVALVGARHCSDRSQGAPGIVSKAEADESCLSRRWLRSMVYSKNCFCREYNACPHLCIAHVHAYLIDCRCKFMPGVFDGLVCIVHMSVQILLIYVLGQCICQIFICSYFY